MKAWIKKQVSDAGGVAAIEADAQISGQGAGLIDQMFSDFLAAFPGVDWNALQSVIQTFSGERFSTPTAAFQWLVNWVVGIDAHQTAIAAAEKSQTTQGGISGSDLETFQAKAGRSGPGGVFGNSDAANNYVEQSQQSGKRDPVIEQLLSNMNQGGYSQQDQMVSVRVKGGSRVMTLAEAVKNFPDLLATGEATFIGGQLAGQSVAQVSGMSVDKSSGRMAAASAEKTNPNGANIGQALTDYLRDNPVDRGDGKPTTGTNVSISLSDDAKRWLRTTVTQADDLTDPNARGDTDPNRVLGMR
jgi:hypothetical protein